MPRTVLAIDPGTTETAWLIYDREKRIPITFGKELNADVLFRVRQGSWDLTSVSHPHDLAIEMVESFGMPVGKEIFQTVFWIGRFCEAWEERLGKGSWAHVTRKDVKRHVCGTTKATDPNIRQQLLDTIGPQGTKRDPGPTYGLKKDLWSCLAIAVTWSERPPADPPVG